VKVCLAIGGSDSCAGAGIQADLATFAAFGVKGCSAITALTAQNPDDICRIEASPLPQLEAEIRAIFDYYDVAAIKTGMLVDSDHIHLVAGLLEKHHSGKPLVVDPVMVSSSGEKLLDTSAIATLKSELLPLATLMTPNLPEAEMLLGRKVSDPAEDACELAGMFGSAVLLKGGHGKTKRLVDMLYEVNGDVTPFVHHKRNLDAEQSHGTGCRLTAAITAQLAAGNIPLAEATARAIEWLQTNTGRDG